MCRFDFGRKHMYERLGWNLTDTCTFFVHGRIDPDAAFRLSVQISQFSTKLDDGSSVEVQRKCFEWVVDYHCYTIEKTSSSALSMEPSSRMSMGRSKSLMQAEDGVREAKLFLPSRAYAPMHIIIWCAWVRVTARERAQGTWPHGVVCTPTPILAW